jgi:hypothetical protein
MEFSTNAILATLAMFTIWGFGAVILFLKERAYYKKRPYAWQNRHAGLISLSDEQRYWCYALWPLVVCCLAVYCGLLVIALVVEYLCDRRYEAKYPNVVNLSSVQFPTGHWNRKGDHDGDQPITTIRHGDIFIPARGIGYATLRQRFKCAWLVFTGKADALVWPGDQ